MQAYVSKLSCREMEAERTKAMDLSYLLWLQQLREGMGGVLDGFFEAVSYFVISPYVYILLALLYWCVSKRDGMFALMNLSVSNAANNAVKLTACVYRPWIRDARIVPVGDSITTATGYSFPSGHSQHAAAEFGSIAVWQKKRKWVVALCAAAIALVMLSRNYLGVHTPQDVLVGCTVGLLTVFLCGRLLRWMEGGDNRDLIALGVSLAAGVLLLLYFTFKPYPMDYNEAGALIVDPVKMQPDAYAGIGEMWGFFIGMVLERRFVRFDVSGSIPVRAARGAVGALLLWATTKLRQPFTALMGPLFGYLVWFMLVMVFVLFLYPLLFTAAERRMGRGKDK